MGCWNYQIFCDDTVWDALDELMESGSRLEDIEKYLDNVIGLEEEYIDYDECQYGLTAASIVDAVQNGIDWSLLSDTEYDEENEYIHLLQELKEFDVRGFLPKAIKVIELVEGEDSELRELWEENENLYPKWVENLNKMKQRLEHANQGGIGEN